MTWTICFAAAVAAIAAGAMAAFMASPRVRRPAPPATVRDGLAAGCRAPAWSLPGVSGQPVSSPPQQPLQVVVLADHCLAAFPSVADGLRDLIVSGEPIELALLLREPSQPAAAVVASFGLHAMPVVLGSPDLYAAYNVRTGPYLMFIDSAGRVRAGGLVNYSWQVARLRRLAALPVATARW